MRPFASNPGGHGGTPSLLGTVARPLLYGLAAAAGQLALVAAGLTDLTTLNTLFWYSF